LTAPSKVDYDDWILAIEKVTAKKRLKTEDIVSFD